MPNQTPEQRETALRIAERLLSDHVDLWPDEALFMLDMRRVARAYTDLHAENVGLREALKKIQRGAVDHSGYWSFSIARAALSGSPDAEGPKTS